MKQLDLFEFEDDFDLTEAENFISELESHIEELENQERFFEENNAFNWNKEFPQLCDEHGNWEGFDVILANPPYINSRNKGISEYQKKFYYENYHFQSSQLNTFGIFIEKSFSLTTNYGHFGFIVPNNLLTLDDYVKLRKFILDYTGNIIVTNNLDKIFEKANVDTCMICFNKTIDEKITITEIKNEKVVFSKEVNKNYIKQPEFFFTINSLKNIHNTKIIEKIESKSHILKEIATVSTGLKVYQTGKGKPAQTDEIKKSRKYHSYSAENKSYGRYLAGSDVCRYVLKWSGEYISYGEWIAEQRKSVPFSGKRILVRQIPSKMPYSINAVFTEEQFYNDINSMVIFNSLKYDLKYISAILNSKLISFWFQSKYDKLQRNIFPQFRVKELATFPILKIETNSKEYTQIIKLVDKIMNYRNENLNYKEFDNELDSLIYKFYNLSKEEIRIIENETKENTINN